MVPPLIVLKIKNQKGKVYVPSMEIEITVIDTDSKGLYIVGKDVNGKTVCVDSKDCELIKDSNINDNPTNIVNNSNNMVNNSNNNVNNNPKNTSSTNKPPIKQTENIKEEKVKTKKFGSLIKKNKTK